MISTSGRPWRITSATTCSSTSRAAIGAFGLVESADTTPSRRLAPSGLVTTSRGSATDARRAAVSKWVVVVFPFVPETTPRRLPASSRRNSVGSMRVMIAPLMDAPVPRPVTRDAKAAVLPAAKARRCRALPRIDWVRMADSTSPLCQKPKPADGVWLRPGSKKVGPLSRARNRARLRRRAGSPADWRSTRRYPVGPG